MLATAAADPERIVLVAPDGSLTAGALLERVRARAGGLYEAGVRPGQRVALRRRPRVALVVELHALGWLGATVRPLPLKATAGELTDRLEGTGHRLGDLPGAAIVGDGAPAAHRPWPLDEPRLEVTTTGTTGRPRQIPLTTAQLVFSAFGSAVRLGHLPDDRWVCALPLHHVGGLSILYRCAWYGTTVELHDGFDAAAVDRAIEAGASHVSLVPVMLERLLDHRGDRPFPDSLRVLLIGGAATPRSLAERAAGVGAPVAYTWGMTEAASQVATGRPGEGPESGLAPLPIARVEVEGGALVVEGPLVAGGRLVTSDRGAVDGRGRVHVSGRRDDVIVSGGENIDPHEIERVLVAHPAVREVAVVGRPDPTWGARPVAFLVGDRIDDAALADWCRRELVGFKIPAAFVWVGALPRNDLGKLDRRALARRAAAGG